MQDRTKGVSCSDCKHHLARFLLDYPVSEPLWHAIFGTAFSIFDLWFRLWGVARHYSLCGVLRTPPPSTLRNLNMNWSERLDFSAIEISICNRSFVAYRYLYCTYKLLLSCLLQVYCASCFNYLLSFKFPNVLYASKFGSNRLLFDVS